MKVNKRLYLILGLVCLLNLAAHLYFYPQMPEVIPIHWGSDGAVDGYGPRWMMLVLAVLPLACLALFALVPKMDPKGANYEKFRPLWQGFIIAITLLMAAVSWLTEAEVFGLLPRQGRLPGLLVGGPIGVMLILLGNYMPRVRQNYTFGIKTPWTLADEVVWQRTHRVGGLVFVLMGAAIFLNALFPVASTGGIIGGIVILGVVVMYLYSYLLYKKRHPGGEK